MNELATNLSAGFVVAFGLANLMYCFGGVFLGTLIGVLPGVGSLAAVSMLMPLSFYLPPDTAIIMLAGVYYGAEYGGSTAAILLNLPGTPSSAVTCLDGNAMAKQGRAAVALFVTTIASFAGGTFGIVMLILLAPWLAQLTYAFGPAEYFTMMLLGLVGSATITRGSPIKGLAMVTVGLLLGCVGTDVTSGATRFTFGVTALIDGINIVAIAMGLFGVAEVIASIADSGKHHVKEKVRLRDMLPEREEVRMLPRPFLRGATIGSIFGALPGAGQTLAAFMAYSTEKQISRHPERFGTGVIEGIAAPETANNSAVQSAFIPTLILGVPGSATMALMMGALMVHGIAPGPSLMEQNADVFWGLVASFWIGNILLLVLNIPLISLWVALLRVPYVYLYPAIICLICIGVFSLQGNTTDVLLVLGFGLIGYAMRLLDFEPAPLIVGFVLGPLMEENLRRAMLLSRGDPAVFIEPPISAGLLVVTVAILGWVLWGFFTKRSA